MPFIHTLEQTSTLTRGGPCISILALGLSAGITLRGVFALFPELLHGTTFQPPTVTLAR